MITLVLGNKNQKNTIKVDIKIYRIIKELSYLL